MTIRLQRVEWDGVVRELGQAWSLKKGDDRAARCTIRSHPYGWELVLFVNNELIRARAFRDSDPLIETAGEWKVKPVAAGWEQLPAVEYVQGARFCNDGWTCEEHPDRGWPHATARGPGCLARIPRARRASGSGTNSRRGGCSVTPSF